MKKIKDLMLKNFGKVDHLSININPGVNFLIGENGSGKTTAGQTGIWFVLKGLAQKGPDVFHAERFRFIGPNAKSAKGRITIIDEHEGFEAVVERKITKSTPTLKITASDGRQLGQAWLDEIFNVFTMNIFSLSKMPPKEQALALGIDTSKHDSKIKALFEERKEAKKEAARLRVVADKCEQVAPVKPVDLTSLLKQKEEIDQENHKKANESMAKHNKRMQEAIAYNGEQGRLAEKQRIVMEAKEAAKEAKKAAQEALDKALKEESELIKPDKLIPTDFQPEEVDLIDTEEISNQIINAEETNERARRHEEYVKAIKEYAQSNRALRDMINNYEEAIEDKTAYIQQSNLPFSNMTIDENGGLLVSDKPFCEPYFSKGEIMRMSMTLAVTQAKAGELKYIFIPDANSLDPKNREKTIQFLSNKGFQVMVEIADTKKIGDNSILLKERRVVDSYEVEEGGVEL